jgi:phenylpyruvate tautomerase PptA (4-oxalocrotonate tautomerase family)
MPLCTIKMLEGEVTDAQTADLTRRVTEAMMPSVGEKLIN